MKLQDANLQVYEKKTLSHILRPVFCLHSLRMHPDYFFQRRFESVEASLF